MVGIIDKTLQSLIEKSEAHAEVARRPVPTLLAAGNRTREADPELARKDHKLKKSAEKLDPKAEQTLTELSTKQRTFSPFLKLNTLKSRS